MPIKLVIVKPCGFCICLLFFPIKEYENFTVKNFEYGEAFTKEQQHWLLKSGQSETPL